MQSEIITEGEKMNYKRNIVALLRRISPVTLGLLAFLAFCIALTDPAAAADLLHNSNDTGSGTSKWPNGWGIAGGRYGQFICATCHEPDADNEKNIRATISSMNGDLLPNGSTSVAINFLNQTSMGDDSKPRTASNRICEVCHSQNKFHNYSTTSNLSHGGALGHPNPKQVCVSCHKHNTGFKAACGGCHGNPPTSASLGNYSGMIGTPRASNTLTPGQPGAHRAHVSDHSLVCDTCHYIDPQSGQSRMPNQSGTVQIGFFGFGGKVTSGTFTPFTSATRGYPFAAGSAGTIIAPGQTSNANANICSNVYCHGGGAPGKAPLTGGTNQTPRWDGSGQTGCGSCHGASPTATTMGNHQIHAGSATGYSYACNTCHPATDSSHVQGSVRWQFSTTDQRVAGAKYQPAGAATAENSGATGNLAPSSSYGSCSSIYCHYNDTPQWGSSLATDCSGCHGGDEYSASPMVKDAHRTHDFNRSARFDQFDFKCQDCHASVVDATNRVITNKALHSNGTKEVVWSALVTRTSGTVAYNNNDANCSTTYCHSNALNGAPNVTSLSWLGTPSSQEGTFTCNSCHGGFAGVFNPLTTNRHAFHLNNQYKNSNIPHVPVTCHVCHDNTIGPDGQSINHSNGLHINKSYNVTFARFANRSGYYTPGTLPAKGTCRSTYCHGNNNPVWTSTTLLTCGQCHEASNRNNTFSLSSSHIKHYNTTTRPTAANGWTNVNNSTGTTNRFMCGVCHAEDPATHHVNGQAMPNGAAADLLISLPFTVTPSSRQYPADGLPVITRGTTVIPDRGNYFFSRETTCQVYCHSNARGGPPVNTMYWANTTTSCGNCHNKAGDADPTWSGAHTDHETSPITTAITCQACHSATASGNNTLASRRDLHPNGFINLTGTVNTSFRWNGTNCTNNKCHYGGTTPNWVGGVFTTSHCIGCHGGTASTTNPMNKMGHGAHINNQSAKFGSPRYNCNECHNTVVYANNTSILGPTLHVNGTNNVSWGPLSTGGGAYNAGACATIYCHSNGAATLTYKAPTNWRTLADGTQGTVQCDYCHNGLVTDTAPMSSNRHTNHINSNPAGGINHMAIACDDCHDNTVAAGGTSILAGNNSHINKKVDINFAKFDNRSGSYSGTATKQCSNTYCHGYKTMTWTTTTVNVCGDCHAASNTFSFGLSSTHRKHYNSGTNATNANGWTSSLSQTTATNFVANCGVCHNVTPGTNHVNGPVSASASAELSFNIPVVPSGAARPNTPVYGSTIRTDGGGYFFSSGTTCDVYCHSDARGGPSKTQFVWSKTTFSCGKCHNSAKDGDPSPTWSAPHTKHIRTYFEAGNSNIGCYACHKSTVFAQSSSIADKRKHVNGYRNVSSSSFSGFTYVAATKACNTGYCHSDGKLSGSQYASPTWTAIAANCTGCHGSATANSTGGSTLSGRHAKHLNPASNPMIGTGNGFKCADCHALTITNADNLTITDAGRHVNKIINYSGAKAGGSAKYNTGTKVCTNIYCHSNGNPNALVFVSMTGSKTWTTSTYTITTCNKCHGRSNNLGYPDYTNGGANKANSNLHPGHLVGMTDTTACADCHRKTPDASVPSQYRPYSTMHLNGTPNLYFNTDKNYVGAKATVVQNGYQVTCSNVVCHGQGTPIWGSQPSGLAGVRTCTKCHGTKTTADYLNNYSSAMIAPGYNGEGTDTTMNKALPTDPRVGAHQRHLVSNVITAVIKCGECHVTVTNIRSGNHWNYSTATITFSGRATTNNHTNAAASRTDGIMQCSNTQCHTGKSNSGNYVIPFWTYTGLIKESTLTVASCQRCHGFPPKTVGSGGTALSYDHTALADPTSFPVTNCSGCHTNISSTGTNYNDIFTTKALHIDGVIQASGGHSFPNPGSIHNTATGYPAFSSCVNGSCHTNGSNATYPVPALTAPDCTSCHKRPSNETSFGIRTSGASSCYDCHGSSSTDGRPNGSAFPNYSGSHTKHVVTQNLSCATCHGPYGGGVGDTKHGFSNRTAHNYTFVNVTSTSAQFKFSWTGKGTCSTNSCHATAEWGVSKLQCNSCHSYDSSDPWNSTYGIEGVGAHKLHIDYIKTRWNQTLDPAGDLFGSGAAAAVCGVCHSTDPADHSKSKAVNSRNINFGGSTTRQFGTITPTYNGTSGTSSSVNPKSCMNTDCHYRTSPIWSTY